MQPWIYRSAHLEHLKVPHEGCKTREALSTAAAQPHQQRVTAGGCDNATDAGDMLQGELRGSGEGGEVWIRLMRTTCSRAN